MEIQLISSCCEILTLNVIAKKGINSLKEFDSYHYSLLQSIAFGAILVHIQAISKYRPLYPHFGFIPPALSFTLSSLIDLTRDNDDNFSEKMKAVERNLGKWMTNINQILSVALLILLIPQAVKRPIHFGIAVILQGIDIGTSIWNFQKIRSTIEQKNSFQ